MRNISCSISFSSTFRVLSRIFELLFGQGMGLFEQQREEDVYTRTFSWKIVVYTEEDRKPKLSVRRTVTGRGEGGETDTYVLFVAFKATVSLFVVTSMSLCVQFWAFFPLYRLTLKTFLALILGSLFCHIYLPSLTRSLCFVHIFHFKQLNLKKSNL